MKRHFLFAFLGSVLLTFNACQDNLPDTPVLDAYPKKHLIEEFTGQTCGYCPYGMNSIHEFMAQDTNWVLILHHYGYQEDNFSVDGSKTIMNKLKVDGAPSASIDRAKTKYKDDDGITRNAVVFHPGYLETVERSQFATTTYASVVINNQYDAATRELKVQVVGAVATNDHPDLYLTVLIKESGMIDSQADYYYSFKGWKEFRHTNAVRAFLTDAEGDRVTIRGQRYSADYTITLDEKWVPENCMVVAFLSEAFQPVVQAEQRPVVEGTKGGADINFGGITPVPVTDYYPEPSATKAPSDYSGQAVDTMTVLQTDGTNYPSDGFKFWNIMTYNPTYVFRVGSTRCVPFAYLYLFTELNADTIPYGTYELTNTYQPGTAYAGYRDDEAQQIGGSILYYVSKSYLDQGYLDPKAQWLIVEGNLTVSENGLELIGHSRNGSDIHIVYPTPLTYGNASYAPESKKMHKNLHMSGFFRNFVADFENQVVE